MRKILIAAACIAFAASSGSAYAAQQCRDAKGKFIKCDAAAPAKKVCKDDKGKFAKCGSPGAKPVG